MRGELPVFRQAETWQEAAAICKGHCDLEETSKALTDQHYQTHAQQESGALTGPAAQGAGKRGGRKGKAKGQIPPVIPPTTTSAGGEQTFVQTMPSEPGACFGCGRGGHSSKLCPKKAAERRGEVEVLSAEFAKTGQHCTICASIGQKCGDHRARHHNLAAQDAFGVANGSATNATKGDSSGKGTGKGNKGKGKVAI